MARSKTFRKKRKYKHTNNNNNNNNNKRTSKKNYKKTYKKRRLMKGGKPGDRVIDPFGVGRLSSFTKSFLGKDVMDGAREAINTNYDNKASGLTQGLAEFTSSPKLAYALRKRTEELAAKVAKTASDPNTQKKVFDAAVATVNTVKTQTVALFNILEQELAEATNEEKDAKQEIITLNITKEELEKEKAITASAKQKKDAEAEAVKQKERAEAEAVNNKLEEIRKSQDALEKIKQEKLEKRLRDTKAKLEAAEARRLKAISDKERAIKEREELNKQLKEDEEEEENAQQAMQVAIPVGNPYFNPDPNNPAIRRPEMPRA